MAYSRLVARHPEAGGDPAAWAELERARAALDEKLDAIERRDDADGGAVSAFPPLSEIGPAQLDEATKEERLHRINERQLAHALERSQRYLGRLEEVLVEGRNVKRPTQVTGRTRGNRIVFFDGDADTLVGKLVDVRITEAAAFSLVGEMCGEPR